MMTDVRTVGNPTPRVYLDFNASTPLAPEVVAAMTPLLAEAYGNPSSLHWAGVAARDGVEHARVQTATSASWTAWRPRPDRPVMRARQR